MTAGKPFGLLGAATAAALCAIAVFGGEASAAPPIVCVRNSSNVEIEVVAGVQATSPQKFGIYLGSAKARGGACRYADIDGAMNASVRRAVRGESPGEQYREIETANGGWIACPAQTSENGWYVYTVRRTRAGLACKVGGEIRGLEDPGDYE